MKLLLHEHPVAGDLRAISAALKMISDMERIGDQAADIADLSSISRTKQLPEISLISGRWQRIFFQLCDFAEKFFSHLF